MTDHSHLIERARFLEAYNGAGVHDYLRENIRELADALSSQSLSLSEAREENERLRGLVAGIRECPQEPWRDIATAPKDGTRVLLTAFGGQIGICFLA